MAKATELLTDNDNKDDDYDGIKFFRGCLFMLPLSLLLWMLILLLLAWMIG